MKDKVKLILITLLNLFGIGIILGIIWLVLGFAAINIPCGWGANSGYIEHGVLLIFISSLIEYFVILKSNKIINNKKKYYLVITIISIIIYLPLLYMQIVYYKNFSGYDCFYISISEQATIQKNMLIHDLLQILFLKYYSIIPLFNIPTLLAFLTVHLKRRVK